MTEEHPNVTLLRRFDPRNVAGSADVLSEDFVWHYFNPLFPDIQGDSVGRDGLQAFFESLAGKTNGTFEVNPISIIPVGDELLVVQTENTMVMAGQKTEVLAVVVWRIVDGLLAEAWDIPAVHTAKVSQV